MGPDKSIEDLESLLIENGLGNFDSSFPFINFSVSMENFFRAFL